MKKPPRLPGRLRIILTFTVALLPFGCRDDSGSSAADFESSGSPTLTVSVANSTPTETFAPTETLAPPTASQTPLPTRADPTETAPIPQETPTLAATGTRTPTSTPESATCGNAEIEPGEECDDGGICIDGRNDSSPCSDSSACGDGFCRPVGGDGCAFNCTLERLRSTPLDRSSGAVVQQSVFPIRINLAGIQGLRTGKPRGIDVYDVHGDLLTRRGDYPVVIKTTDVTFEPVRVGGLVCACVRQVAVPFFGPGNSAVGIIGCGPTGLSDIDYQLVQDHNTTPGDPNNGNSCTPPQGPQLPDDPTCSSSVTLLSGVVSNACREGADSLCADADENFHHGICNSPRRLQVSGGMAAPGAALINNNTAIALLNDAGLCRTDLRPGDSRCPADYGEDCLPCTDDDLDLGDPENIPTTTGMATAGVFDAANQKGRTIFVGSGISCSRSSECASGEECVRQCENTGAACPTGEECGADDVCGPPHCDFTGCGNAGFVNRCIVTVTGASFDCMALANDQIENDGDGDGLSGAALAAAFPTIDALRIGDNVTTSLLVMK